MNRSRKRALRSPQNDETMLGGTTGAGNPALTDPSPTPLTCGLKHSQTCRAKSETPHYFALEVGHTNYQALYSLALSAAINRYPLLIRTQGEISSSAKALVQYMVVDW
jgi:hypothetical protein